MLSILTNDFNIQLNGLSTDTKPSLEAKYNGSIFTEIDSGRVFMYDGEHQTWYKLPGLGKPDEQKYVAGNGVAISKDNIISIDVADIKLELNLAAVATSGSYLDLTDKPDIPEYTAGFGIKVDNSQISVDTDTIATVDSVKTLLADADNTLVINAESISVKDSLGNLVPVATTNLLTTDSDPGTLEPGCYVFMSI